MKDLFIECSCHGEAIRAEKQEDGDVWFSFWQHGFGTKELNLKNRIRLMWQILRTGHSYTDMIILEKNKVEKLVEFLKE